MAGLGPWILDGRGRKVIVPSGDGTVDIKGFGVIDRERLKELDFGSNLELAGKRFKVYRPVLSDLLDTGIRKAQVVLIKDSAQIVARCGIGPGSVVAEAGLGSGFLTMALALAVGEGGKVHSFEREERLGATGVKNLERSGLISRVDVHWGDAVDGLGDLEGLDAVVLDLPEPWTLTETVRDALRGGGWLCTYLPTTNQVEKSVNAMRDGGFRDVYSIEVIEREIVVGDGGVRPAHDMLGHTAYLSFGRRE